MRGVATSAPAVLAGQNVHHLDALHTVHLQQRPAQLLEHRGAQGRCIDVDVWRYHLHRIEVQIASAKQRQDFLGDADAVDEADVDAH